MKKIYLIFSLLLTFHVSGQTINFPDPVFKSRLLTGSTTYDSANNLINIDVNADGEIQLSEALLVSKIDIQNQWDGIVTDITGIANFTNLKKLNLVEQNIPVIDLTGLINLEECKIHICNTLTLNSSNVPGLISLAFIFNPATSLDVSNNISLKRLNVEHNQLTSIDISNLSNLEEFQCQNNHLTTLDASGLAHLKDLRCFENQLTSINLTGLVNLQILVGNNNQIASFDFTGLGNLDTIYCSNNQLTTLDLSFNNIVTYVGLDHNNLTSVDLSGCAYLTTLYLGNNQLVSVDGSNCPHLNHIEIQNNALEYLNIKKGPPTEVFNIDNNPNLAYVCVDEYENPFVVQNYLASNFPNCTVSTYCSFVPGGEYFTVSGTTSFSESGNCDAESTPVPLQAVIVSSEQNSGTFVAGESGTYTIPLIAGTYTLTPVSPNPAYYAVSPESITLTLPNITDPYTQNFCIAPIGAFNDLEVTLLPIVPARPGFDAKYRLIYRNKGTTEQFAGVFFTYNDALLDYVSSTLAPNTTSTGSLFWEVDNLKPFEEGVIDIILNVNSPVETPAVNINDILTFEANIQNPIPEDVEQTINDNTYTFNQKVIGSFDPNDKTCVEGTTIMPDMAGEYVTYLIRFENTGNYHAENVVVKDVIDPEKFDISSLKPSQSSHPYITRINNNTAEFIFEHIMLAGVPSEERYGFVAFKIKTKATLQLNDTFSNTAAIYFDFNAPVITNEAVTTLTILGTDDFVFANNISLYPNPASTILNVEIKDMLSIHSFEVYNMIGQRVLEIQNPAHTSSIDIARLTAGTYILKALTDKGAAHTKFIKK